jgi:hypothetical protein
MHIPPPGVQPQGPAGLSPGHGDDFTDNWMIPTMKNKVLRIKPGRQHHQTSLDIWEKMIKKGAPN